MENQFIKRVTYNGLSVKYALGPTSMRGNEIHTYHEILYFMTDGAILYTKYGQRQIHDNTLVIIPKYTYHRTDIKDESKYRRIAMNFDDMFEPALFQEIMDDIHVFENIPENIMRILRKMIHVFDQDLPDYKCELMQYACFIQLAIELSMQKNPQKAIPAETNATLSSIITYIDDHLTETLNENIIAKALFCSPSTVRATISRNLNTSLHKYIVKKRLIQARKLLETGMHATQIYQKCGFSDYSTFYRAYKNYFGVAPSGKNKRE